MTPVEVTWWDAAAGIAAWTDVEDLTDEMRIIRTVGMLVATDENHILLALSYDAETNHVDTTLKIPHPMVLDIVYLEPPPRRRWWQRR